MTETLPRELLNVGLRVLEEANDWRSLSAEAMVQAVGRAILGTQFLYLKNAELHERAEAAEAQVARIRSFLEDMAGWCSPHGVAADYSRRGLDALDGVDPLGLAGPTREQLAAAEDGFRWHVLSKCPDEAACPIHGRNEDEGEPTGREDVPELTREDAVEAMQEMAQDLYTAQDRLAFIAEQCTTAERDSKPITVEQVRSWLAYNGCGGAIVLPEDEQERLKAAMTLHSLTGRIIDQAQRERWEAAGRCGVCGFDGDRSGCQDCGGGSVSPGR